MLQDDEVKPPLHKLLRLFKEYGEWSELPSEPVGFRVDRVTVEDWVVGIQVGVDRYRCVHSSIFLGMGDSLKFLSRKEIDWLASKVFEHFDIKRKQEKEREMELERQAMIAILDSKYP